jgi:TetR/AcrR family transcriptional regulator, transcriptional repressor for nem operon
MMSIMNAMRYPVEDTAERHEQILDAASQMFRQNGFDGVSVAGVMKAAGLTHGGFYAHFESKDALAAASVERSLSETLDLVEQAGEAAEPLVTLVTEYLSAQHRDDPARGCTMAALASEISRANGPVRHTFTAQISALVERIAGKFFPAQRSNGRADAIVTMSTLVGALLIARAVDDPVLSAEILAANRAHFGVGPEVGE